MKQLKKTEFLGREEILNFQFTKYKALEKVAKNTVPYWSEVIREITEEEFKQSRLSKMPILTKKIAKERGEEMWSAEVEEYIVATTGGTTGYPLTIRRSIECDEIIRAALWRARISWGAAPGVRGVHLFSFGSASFLGNLRMRMGNKKIGDAFPSSKEDMDAVSKMISQFKPKTLEGFATGLLASMEATSNKKDISIPVIISTGEMLYDHQRKALEEHYHGKVYTYYGCNEIGAIAFECEHQNLHVCEEHVIVETVDENGKPVIDEPGDLLVTDLDNIAMPLIRYKLGDIGVLSSEACSCGRGSQYISKLIGRSQDFLSGDEGRKLQATQLSGFLKDLTLTGQLQFIQKKEDKIIVFHDYSTAGTGEELELIENHLKKRLGGSVKIEFKLVDEIEKTGRGKQPLVLRKLES